MVSSDDETQNMRSIAIVSVDFVTFRLRHRLRVTAEWTVILEMVLTEKQNNAKPPKCSRSVHERLNYGKLACGVGGLMRV